MAIVYPDPLPLKLRAQRALTEALKTITPDNGFVFDLADFDPGDGVTSARVFRGRPAFGDSDPLPMVSILEMPELPTDIADPPPGTRANEYWWWQIIQGWVEDDRENPTDPAYVLLADIRRRLIAEKSRKLAGASYGELDILGLGNGFVQDIYVGSGVVRPPSDMSPNAWLSLRVGLRIVDDASKPYD